MKKLFFLYILFLSTTVLFSQNNTQLVFEKANNLYKEGKYQEAVKLYQEIEATDAVSSALYYNLGNAYYKLNSVANTIYYYEKALLLDPLNTDVKNNLAFAKRMTIDRIEALPQTFLQRLNANYLQKLSYNQWALIAVICSFIAAILFLLFYASSISIKKRVYFLTSMFSFVLLIATTTIAYNQYQIKQSKKYAIVFASKTTVKNAPTINSDEVFELHEGTKVTVLDAVDDWKKIKLADGKIGWITANDIKMLTNN
ncbi:MAG: SH3 domain-containing protein [Flavobacteriaceae bacterium]|nr:SH3 domain-containing protein [Flavobacteriaceae bacterium]